MLFIFVEGLDDERFFKRVVIPEINHLYSYVRIIKYANQTKKYIRNYLKSLKKMEAEIYFVADLNASPCITNKKKGILRKFSRYLTLDNIFVVILEIESWYIAGLTDKIMRRLQKKTYKNTNSLTKEEFNSHIPKKFNNRIDYMQEILDV